MSLNSSRGQRGHASGVGSLSCYGHRPEPRPNRLAAPSGAIRRIFPSGRAVIGETDRCRVTRSDWHRPSAFSICFARATCISVVDSANGNRAIPSRRVGAGATKRTVGMTDRLTRHVSPRSDWEKRLAENGRAPAAPSAAGDLRHRDRGAVRPRRSWISRPDPPARTSTAANGRASFGDRPLVAISSRSSPASDHGRARYEASQPDGIHISCPTGGRLSPLNTGGTSSCRVQCEIDLTPCLRRLFRRRELAQAHRSATCRSSEGDGPAPPRAASQPDTRA
jgi:hypothetical protein